MMIVRLRYLVLVFAVAEIACFVIVARLAGLAVTFALVVAGFLVGGLLLRRQGASTIARLRRDVAARRAPTGTLADGVVKAAAAILLIIPGFLSDAVGLLLLLPAVRRVVRRFGAQWFGTAYERTMPSQHGRRVISLNQTEFHATDRTKTAATDET